MGKREGGREGEERDEECEGCMENCGREERRKQGRVRKRWEGKGRGGIYYRKEKAGLTAKNMYVLMNTRS